MYGGHIGTHQRSFGWYHPRPPMPPASSKFGFCNLPTPLISGTGKALDFKFGGYIYRTCPNKSPLKILEKTECGRIQGLPHFGGVPPIISGTGRATDFKFDEYIYRADTQSASVQHTVHSCRLRITLWSSWFKLIWSKACQTHHHNFPTKLACKQSTIMLTRSTVPTTTSALQAVKAHFSFQIQQYRSWTTAIYFIFMHATCPLSATNQHRHIVISFVLFLLNYDFSWVSLQVYTYLWKPISVYCCNNCLLSTSYHNFWRKYTTWNLQQDVQLAQ